MTKQEANKEILATISEWIEWYPDMDFIQLLSNLDLVENVNEYEDSITTLKLMKTSCLLRGES